MTERPDDTRLHDWLDETVGQTPDPVEGTQQVMSQVEETSQVGRWLPFPLFHRKVKVKPPATTDTTTSQPSPIPASNGHTPTVIGRTQSMFSPVKAITAGALVFALGGVFLIAQPFDQRGTAPGAEVTDVAPTWITGDIGRASSCTDPDTEIDGDVVRERNAECSPQRWTSSDQRFTGEVRRLWNHDVYELDEGTFAVETGAAYLQNEDGGWTCVQNTLNEGSGFDMSDLAGPAYTLRCIGEDGYEGLSAILASEFIGSTPNEQFVGLIFSGDVPPLPESPATE